MHIEISDIKRRTSNDGKSVKLSPAERKRVDIDEAQRWLRKAADGGYIDAKVLLGNKLLQKNDVTAVNVTEAIKLYTEAATFHESKEVTKTKISQTQRDAMYNLGNIYYEGYTHLNILPNPIESVKWFNKAKEYGDYSATFLLGHLYKIGYPEGGININSNQSITYLKDAVIMVSYMYMYMSERNTNTHGT